MFQTFHWMQNTRQRTLQQAQPHCRTGTHKRKALFSLSPPNKIVWEAYPMVKSPGKYHNIHTKSASAHNQTWSPSDALLTGGARVGFGAYVQSPTSNNTTHKLSIQKWAQGAADELCLTAPGLCSCSDRAAQVHSHTWLMKSQQQHRDLPWEKGEWAAHSSSLQEQSLCWGEQRAEPGLDGALEAQADLQSFQRATAVLQTRAGAQNLSLKTFPLCKLCLASVLILCPF